MHGTPTDYVVRILERILEMARRVGATRYVNAPGRRCLYDADAFDRAGIGLRFQPEYAGPATSIMGRIAQEPRDALTRDVKASI